MLRSWWHYYIRRWIWPASAAGSHSYFNRHQINPITAHITLCLYLLRSLCPGDRRLLYMEVHAIIASVKIDYMALYKETRQNKWAAWKQCAHAGCLSFIPSDRADGTGFSYGWHCGLDLLLAPNDTKPWPYCAEQFHEGRADKKRSQAPFEPVKTKTLERK